LLRRARRRDDEAVLRSGRRAGADRAAMGRLHRRVRGGDGAAGAARSARMDAPVAATEARALCAHCGLPAPSGARWCCYGCELAARVQREAREDHATLLGTFTFLVVLAMVVMMLALFLYAEDVFDAGADRELAWLRAAYRWASWILATPVMLLGG